MLSRVLKRGRRERLRGADGRWHSAMRVTVKSEVTEGWEDSVRKTSLPPKEEIRAAEQ